MHIIANFLFVSVLSATAAAYYDGYLEMLNQVNAERAKVGKDALCNSAKLMESALTHSKHQASIPKLTHDAPSPNSSIMDRCKNVGFSAKSAAENVGRMSDQSVSTVMKAWMESSGHKANILGDYTHFGSSVVRGSDGQYYWTQHFASASGSEACMEGGSQSPPTQTSTYATPKSSATAPGPTATTTSSDEGTTDTNIAVPLEGEEQADAGLVATIDAEGNPQLGVQTTHQLDELRRKAAGAKLQKKRDAKKKPKYICIHSTCYRVVSSPSGDGFMPVEKKEMKTEPISVAI